MAASSTMYRSPLSNYATLASATSKKSKLKAGIVSSLQSPSQLSLKKSPSRVKTLVMPEIVTSPTAAARAITNSKMTTIATNSLGFAPTKLGTSDKTTNNHVDFSAYNRNESEQKLKTTSP